MRMAVLLTFIRSSHDASWTCSPETLEDVAQVIFVSRRRALGLFRLDFAVFTFAGCELQKNFWSCKSKSHWSAIQAEQLCPSYTSHDRVVFAKANNLFVKKRILQNLF
ncbi:hypothetical protein V5799_024036 [Amblyomma americanum]|uniref:Uncharacterized protein n=1 Tax=Amblyomma americanum TaxID=6943 RepID=A0AAQ4EDP0_AMBAM